MANYFGLLMNELVLLDQFNDRYQANYHLWSHRKWVLADKAPVPDNPTGTRRVTAFSAESLAGLFQKTLFSVYLHELEKNERFVSTHVSDHCGIHFRSFLIDQIFLFIRNCDIDLNTILNVTQGYKKQAKDFYLSVVNEMSKNLEMINDQMKNPILTEYVANFSSHVEPFAIEAALLLNELNKNAELIQFYPSHEALWCYRKYLMHKFNASFEESQRFVANRVFLAVINNERRLVKLSSILIGDPADERVLKNYCNYVKKALKIDLEF